MLTVATMLQFIDLINEQTRQIVEVTENSITMEMLDVNMYYYDNEGKEHGWEDLIPFPAADYSLTYGDGHFVTITFKNS